MQSRYNYPLSNRTHMTNKTPDWYEDPLNYTELYEFTGLFEAWASIGTWWRTKKSIRGVSPDANVYVNVSELKPIIQK